MDIELVSAGPALPAEANGEGVAGREGEQLAAAEDGGFPRVAEFGFTVRGVEGFLFFVGWVEKRRDGDRGGGGTNESCSEGVWEWPTVVEANGLVWRG
jgi:hypothetical protein